MSKRGVSWSLAMILLFLIALSGGFIVRFALGSMLENEIQKTLGLRLLLHSFSLMRSSFNSFPQGVVWTKFTAPSTECKITCLDCYQVNTVFGSTAICDCDNYEIGLFTSQAHNYCCQGTRYTDYNIPSFCNLGCESPYYIEGDVAVCTTSNDALIPDGGCICGGEFYLPDTTYYCCEGRIYTEDAVPEYCEIGVGNESPLQLRNDWGEGTFQCLSSTKAQIPASGCLCGDPSQPKAELPQLPPHVPANQMGLVCDDFTIVGLDQVVMARNVEPAAIGIKMDIRAHPGTQSYWVDYGSSIATIYTENVLDLYDYFSFRGSLITDEEYPVPFEMDDQFFTLFKKSEWDYDTLTKGSDKLQGLKGIVDRVYYHCSNTTLEGPESDYCLVSGTGNEKKGVRCPGPDGILYPLLIPPGYKINQSGTVVCEYECVEQNTFGSCLSDEWVQTTCFDFKELSKSCHGCSCDQFEFELDLCASNGYECYGNVSPIKTQFDYTDIYTDSSVDISPILIDVVSLNPIPELWGLSHDCTIYFQCQEDGSIKVDIEDSDESVGTGGPTIIDWRCDSNNIKDVVFQRESIEEQTLIIKDHPRRSALEIRFTENIVEMEYEVLITGENSNEPAEDYARCPGTQILLLPFEEYPRSLRVSALKQFVQDELFGLFISNNFNLDSTPDKMKIRIGGVDCTRDNECNDDNRCTTDFCISGVCNYYPAPDGYYGSHNCFNGEEVDCIINNDCDDSNVCTTDSCSTDGVCTNAPLSGVIGGTQCSGGLEI